MFDESSAVIRDNEKSDNPSGVGIFKGPPSESAERWGCLVPLILCIICAATVGVVMMMSASRPLEYIIPSICTLLTLFLGYHAVIIFRTPQRPKKQLRLEGVWLTRDKAWLGGQEVEIPEEAFVAELYKRESTRITALRPDAKDTGQLWFDPATISLNLQIVNSKYNAKNYRIACIHVKRNGTYIRTYNLMLSRDQVLVIDGFMYTCKMLPLVKQLKKILSGLDQIQLAEIGIFSLSITPRSSSGGAWMMYGAIGGVVKGIADSVKASNVKDSLRRGDFIDQETGEVLLELIEKHRWNIEIRPLGMNELGLAGSEW